MGPAVVQDVHLGGLRGVLEEVKRSMHAELVVCRGWGRRGNRRWVVQISAERWRRRGRRPSAGRRQTHSLRCGKRLQQQQKPRLTQGVMSSVWLVIM